MNTNPLHFDEHFASQSQHGPLSRERARSSFALTVGMSVRDISENALANLEYEKVLAPRPDVPRRHDLRESEVLEVTPSTPKNDRGVVTSRAAAVNQKGTRASLAPAGPSFRAGPAPSSRNVERRGARGLGTSAQNPLSPAFQRPASGTGLAEREPEALVPGEEESMLD
jgi:hypothetical protein